MFYARIVRALSDRAHAALVSGRDLIVDRYWLSTWVYAQLLSEPPALLGMEPRIRAAEITFLIDASERERETRLSKRGMNARDAATLEPTVAARLRGAYEAGLARPVAGRVIRIDSTACSRGDALEEVRGALRARPLGLRRGGAHPAPSDTSGPLVTVPT